MAEQLSELDELIESDVLEALGEKIPEENSSEDSSIEIDGITIEDLDEPSALNDTPQEENLEEEIKEDITEEENIQDDSAQEEAEVIVEENTQEDDPIVQEDEAIEETEQTTVSNVSQVNTTDLATLLSELLNNKTIEITIKVKD